MSGRICPASAPRETSAVLSGPRKSGRGSFRPNGLPREANSFAATALSSGRATRSTKPMVKSMPCGS